MPIAIACLAIFAGFTMCFTSITNLRGVVSKAYRRKRIIPFSTGAKSVSPNEIAYRVAIFLGGAFAMFIGILIIYVLFR